MEVRSLDDFSLLNAYVAGDGSAFAEIVRRHGGLVYSAALRQTRDVHLARDVTQAVFMLLSRKARRLRGFVILSAWLYRAACYAARDVMKKERRRHLHEKRAAAFSEASCTRSGTDEVWAEMGPELDDAMQALREKDRTAVLLRFFEGRSLREVGAAMGTSEAAAGQRVNRAIERLRRFFITRGITAPIAAIEISIARHAVGPLPASLHLAATTGAAGASTVITSIANGTSHMIFWSKIKLPAIATAMILAIAAPMIVLQAWGQSPSVQAAVTPGPSKQPYQVALTGGARFELCLADIDAGGNRIWNPDGIPLEPPPFDLVIEKRVAEAKPKQGERRIAAMMRMVDASGNKIPGSFSAGRGVHSFGVGGATVEKNGKPLDGWEVEMATVDARQSSFVLQTGWAIGQWHKMATWDSIGFQYKMLTDDRNWQIQPGLPNAINGSVLIPIALQFPHITDWDERYFAILTNGTRVPASTSLGMRLMNGVGITAFRFDPEKSLKPSDVKSYEMEVLGLTRIVMNLPPSPGAYRLADIQILPPYPLPKMNAESH